ncbi:protoporphyrinogen oxidase HemJ [Pelagivirga sediminicola]|uniref:Protoporphyrinogen IX oxidase n=1 Tax=Pelagivirga sediminicola TaxID=2170575 RepID=A0A2T7G8P7_9RHOB|nr:protoporphyrinogen oxidase HemJ [Pelagivirga sediminicola]PVA10776.1 protoporphyrinogen oxidase HemJ [Pelagivirga sediminicola]
MSTFLSEMYLWTKALHIVSVIAWMAGLFYLPRLFVYHAEVATRGDSRDEIFQVMERRLLRAIMNPAMIATWVFGLALVLTPGVVDWSSVWPWTKTVGVISMTVFHQWLAAKRKALAQGTSDVTGRQFRLMNEVPTVLLILIVFSVVLKF